jgi:hypothetical protein
MDGSGWDIDPGDSPGDEWNVTQAATIDHLPMPPLTSPGMPPPGKDFISLACAMGDEKPKVEKKVCYSAGPILSSLYKSALYTGSFCMPVRTSKTPPRPVQFIPGHLWASQVVEGPKAARVMVIGKWPGQQEANFMRATSI